MGKKYLYTERQINSSKLQYALKLSAITSYNHAYLDAFRPQQGRCPENVLKQINHKIK